MEGIDSLIDIVVEAIVDTSTVVKSISVVDEILGRLVPVVCSTENEVEPTIVEACLSVVVSD